MGADRVAAAVKGKHREDARSVRTWKVRTRPKKRRGDDLAAAAAAELRTWSPRTD
jgi:hypothetical protein